MVWMIRIAHSLMSWSKPFLTACRSFKQIRRTGSLSLRQLFLLPFTIIQTIASLPLTIFKQMGKTIMTILSVNKGIYSNYGWRYGACCVCQCVWTFVFLSCPSPAINEISYIWRPTLSLIFKTRRFLWKQVLQVSRLIGFLTVSVGFKSRFSQS